MVTIFWNVHGRDLTLFVRSLVQDNDADLLVLAESQTPVGVILEELNAADVGWSYAPSLGGSNTHIFVRGSSAFVAPVYDLPRMSIRRVVFPGAAPFILASVHLSSRLWRNDDDQVSESRELVQALCRVESDAGHTRSVVIGDFNMDPFSKGLIFADSWNAVRTLDVADSQSRTVGGTPYSYFYNPMWALLQDGHRGAAGTYFHSPTGYASLHWHILDQVLLRPAMLNYLNRDGVSILRTCSEGSLAGGRGRPQVSDHFPVLLRLRM